LHWDSREPDRPRDGRAEGRAWFSGAPNAIGRRLRMRGQGGIHVGLAAVKVGEGGPAGDGTAPSPHRGRTGLLALGAVSAAVTVVSLSIRGFSWVNLDHLLDYPLSFHSLLPLPTVLALACLTLATMPRTLLINLAVLAGLIAAAETAGWALALVSPAP